MSKLLSLLVVALFAFDATLVAARPQSLQFNSGSPTPLDVKGLNTNTKRFAAGLPPLPPVIRRGPTGVDTAKRAVNSQCAKSGVIEVINVDTSALIGYVSADLTAGRYGLVATPATAGIFSSSVFTSGTTTDINILDTGVTGTDPAYLAGLVLPNQPLGDGDTEADAAILGRSDATNPGDTPQTGRNPTLPGRQSETAIWTYNFADNSLTATWINYPGQTPASQTAYISYLSNTDEFYLTNSRTAPPNGVPVVFLYISVNDGCGSN